VDATPIQICRQVGDRIRLAADSDLGGGLAEEQLPKLPRGYLSNIVKAWDKDPVKIKAFADLHDMKLHSELGNTQWLNVNKRELIKGGGEVSLVPLYRAIRKEFDGFDKFQILIGLKVTPKELRVDFDKLVKEWDSDPIKIKAFADTHNMDLHKELGNSKWLSTKKRELVKGSGDVSLWKLYNAIREEFGGFDKFQILIGIKATPKELRVNFDKLVKEWDKDPVKIKAFADLHNMKLHEELGNSYWLLNNRREIIKGAGKVSLQRLLRAIKKEYDGFDKFQILIGMKVTPKELRIDFDKLVKEWDRDPVKIKAFADLHNMKLHEELGNSHWLRANKRELVKGCGAISISPLYDAIRKEYDSFDKFQILIGMKVTPKELRIDFDKLVKEWDGDPVKIRAFADLHNMNLDTELGNSEWLCISKRELIKGGCEVSLRKLYRAIIKSPYYGHNWKDFRKVLDLETTSISESLKEALSGKEGESLLLLAKELGEAALAEFLVAKHQDRFEYNAQLIQNLRPYLGDLEVSSTLSPEMVPVGVLQIKELSHLKDALFNHYRDKYLVKFTESLDSVVRELKKLHKKAEYEEQKEFINSLIVYFKDVENLAHPVRLKDSLTDKREFPAKHQKMAMYECTNEKRLLVADEMGGGKTGSAIGAFELLRDKHEVKRALVVCPAKALSVWKKALSNGEQGYFKEGKAPNVVVIENGFDDWEAAKKADYIVVSLEKTRTNSTVQKLQELCADFFIFDEAHNAKGTKEKNTDTERIFAIAQADSIKSGYTMLLSGTPIPNTLKDLAAQIRLLYAGSDAESIGNIAGEELNVSHLPTLAKQIINSNPLIVRNLLVRKMLRRKTEDCLPVGTTINREDVYAELSAYDQAKYNTVLELPLFEAKDKLNKLRRICLHSEAKYQAIKDAVNTALSREKYITANKIPKILIAESSFAKGITRDGNDIRTIEVKGEESYIASRLQNDFGANVKVFVLDRLNSNKRSEIIKEFSDYKKPAILLTLISVVGEGLDITAAADGILISPTYTVSAEEQFIRRMFRSGQKMPVDIQRLVFKDLIEHGIVDYAARKERVVKGVIDGRPLTAFEKEILNDDFTKVKAGGVFAYETMSPRQKALWILSHIAGKGQEAIKEYLSANDGKFGRDFANGYAEDEETSYSGNTARLVKGVVDALNNKKKKSILDIACGCRTLERMFEGDRKIEVSSFDINEAALQVGSSMMKRPKDTSFDEVGSMDSLSAKTNSKDIAVLSLALDMSRHTRNGIAGKERFNTLLEINRVLKVGGNAILTCQEKLFDNEDSFNNFAKTIAEHFGFSIKSELSGAVVSTEGGREYRGWILTLTKEDEVHGDKSPKFTDELYLGLKFSKVRHESKEEIQEKKRTQLAEHKSGSCHDSFVIGENSVQFKATTISQLEVEAQKNKNLVAEKCLEERIKELQKMYGSYKDIPEEFLLSISLHEISKETQQARDLYFGALIAKYGSAHKVPLEELSKASEVVLIRGSHSKYGAYLALAKLDTKTGKKNGFGTRYFFE
jgi:SNF2 family DNA or RNA helicase/ubiquinone/menaquinone biosynthesis C-methylase UbiE